MRTITATEEIDTYKPTVFLAGGITNCPEWQNELIELLQYRDDFVLLNPRRENFPMDDPNAAEEQIRWEFEALNNCDIFSMWYTAGISDQPICMYELGRHLALKPADNIVIGVEPGYKRAQDVYIQTELVSPFVSNNIASTLNEHALNIEDAVRRLKLRNRASK